MTKVEPAPRPRGRRASSAQFAARRNEIVDLAAHLFAMNGYAATGIRDIGAAAELARGALYYYIDSKESLLGEIHDRVMDPLLEQARSIASLSASAVARIRLVSEVLMGQIIGHQDHVWVFLHEYRSLSGERRDTFKKKRAEFEGLLIQLLTQGVESGEFAIDDIRGTMLAFLGMHNYTYQWIHGEPLPDPVALSGLYCDIFFRGVLRDPHESAEAKKSPSAL
jgi:AcrR family transcriptional regulator